MKKLLFGLIATVFLSAPMFAQDPPPKEDNPPLIELVFGRVSKGCGGFGICRFKIHITTADVVTLVTAFANPGGLLFKMSPTVYKDNIKSFQNGYLVIEEDYKIDTETCRAVGVADGYTIKKGKYQVVFDKTANTYNCTF
jgi:hypothetical protein